MSVKATNFFITLFFFSFWATAQTTNEWQNSSQGISYKYNASKPIEIQDNIEMSGQLLSTIVDYSVDSVGVATIKREVIFPQVHPKLKSTDADWKIYRAYFKETFTDNEILPKLYYKDRQIILDTLESIKIDGYIAFTYKSINGISISRTIFPSTDKAAYIERFTISNSNKEAIKIQAVKNQKSVSCLTIDGERQSMVSDCDIEKFFEINPKESHSFMVSISLESTQLNSENEWSKRKKFLSQMKTSCVLKTPNENINQLYEFSKIRGSESIFQSRYGLIHSPGGGRYYVGFWANDQAEYISPLFPFLGYSIGNQSALNCYTAFLNEINETYSNIRYSFELEGIAPTPTLDRGDAAMIAYGASQFLLAYSNTKEAERIWPLIEWCLEYNHRMLNEKGVVKSESDEMEGRIETGHANLSTSCLYYGALNQACILAQSMGNSELAQKYKEQAEKLAINLEQYFGMEIEGLKTYRYFEGHENLRHWICMPLVVGINNRKEETIIALFDKLWGENGVYVERNHPNPDISSIFWDRGTLYALRGTFLSGATDQSLNKLIQYTDKRLLKDRVPYAVEAYPEGSMAHLSAESGLYCRVLTEGLFGIQGTGFYSFRFKPSLPSSWDSMELLNNKAFGGNFSILISKEDNYTRVKVINNETLIYNERHESNTMDFIEISLK